VQLGLVIRLGVRRMRLAEPQHLPAVELKEIDGLCRVHVRLDPRLACLQDQHGAEHVLALAHDLRGAEQVARSLGRGNAPPMVERPGGFAHGAVRELRGRLADSTDHLRWLGRIPAHDHLVREDLLPADDQGVGASQLPPHLVETGLEGLHVVGEAEISKRLICIRLLHLTAPIQVFIQTSEV